MDLLEAQVERFWEDVRSIAFAADMTSDGPSKPQQSDAPSNKQNNAAPSKHGLINQHMMLAGFAIENLCKGHLAARLSISASPHRVGPAVAAYPASLEQRSRTGVAGKASNSAKLKTFLRHV